MPTTTYTLAQGEVLSENRNGTERSYVSDVIGSTIALTDSSQNVTDTFSYWPYGEERTHTGTSTTPLKFLGAYGARTDTINRSHIGARELKTNLNRWSQKDGLRADRTRYSYCFDNPLKYRDINGFGAAIAITPGLLAGGGGSAAAGAGTGVVTIPVVGQVVTVAALGWTLGRAIDDATGASDWILDRIWPSELPPVGNDEWCRAWAAIGRPCPPMPGTRPMPPPRVGPCLPGPTIGPLPTAEPWPYPSPVPDLPMPIPMTRSEPITRPIPPPGRRYRNCSSYEAGCKASYPGYPWFYDQWQKMCNECADKCRLGGLAAVSYPPCAFWALDEGLYY